tara:strand:+ start:27 stop:863 length:837 start_codon:yes stop_codon:yes gene_type:complete
MDWYEAIILGIVQGLTEWLPISSSGHLAIAEKALNLDYPVVYDVALHFGTLLVLLYYFKEDVKKIGMKIPSLISKIGKKDAKLEEERMIMMIIISGVMTSLIFVMASAFKIGQYKEKYGITDTEIVGVALIFNALILLASKEVERSWKIKGGMDFTNVPLKAGIFIGIAQGIAVLPGISRSGFTITAGMATGLKPREAARFSFILFIPTVMGAALVKMREIPEAVDTVGIPNLILGTLAAMITGYFCLDLLMKIVEKRTLHWFAPYCLIMGILTLIVY